MPYVKIKKKCILSQKRDKVIPLGYYEKGGNLQWKFQVVRKIMLCFVI